MFQYLTFDEPIPSCSIYALNYNEGRWEFVYCVNTPVLLTNENTKELIVYEYISDLIVKDASGMHKNSINIEFKKLNEYIELLESQRKADYDYRKKWLEKNPDASPNTVILENRSYSFEELHELGIHFVANLSQKGSSTEFSIS